MNNVNRPLERGKRLKNLRGIANLSRQEMSDVTDVNIHTLKSWELGKFQGITIDGAKKITRNINIKKNIYCTVEWIMEGEGEFPYFNNVNNQITTTKLSSEDEKKLFIQASNENKLLSYKHKNNNCRCIYITIEDIGYQKYNGDINNLSGIHVIIELKNGNIIIERFITEKDGNYLFLNENNGVINISKNEIKQINIIKRIYSNDHM